MKPKEQPGRGSFAVLPLVRVMDVAFLLLFAFAGQRLFAQSTPVYPSWWAEYGVLSGTTPSDYAAANQGEAKNIAVAAVSELDNDLAQFGGSQLDGLAATLSGTTAQTSDFSALNLGEMKALSQPFYDRLLALGYKLGPLTSGTYPWAAPGAGNANDFAIGNIGQLKFLFSFDVNFESPGNNSGIPDWWINLYYPGLISSGTTVNPNAFVAWSGSQVTILQAYQQGLNPIDFYNGQAPTLAIVSGNNQTGPPGGFVSSPLVVSVTDTNGNPLYDAPVTFAVTSGSLQASNITSPVVTLTVVADSNGSAQAQAFFQLPNIPSNTSQITVTTGTGSATAQVTFSEFSDNGSTGITYRSPFSPSNVIGTINADGSEDMTWQNNTDPSDTTPIPVWHWNPSTHAWFQIDSVPAGTTSYHVPPNPTPMP